VGKYDDPTPAVIFDIDGTLADCEHRRHFVTGKKKNFDKFYDAMGEDKVKSEIRGLCNSYHMNGWHVVICTGRPEKYREITEEWLKENAIFHSELRMRPDEKRHEPDYEVKQEMLDSIREERSVHIAFDDRNQVVDMWRRNGITCLQVDYGDF
jgi:phosphoglycolate phosphatase-like HAD superfamily hydrolase